MKQVLVKGKVIDQHETNPKHGQEEDFLKITSIFICKDVEAMGGLCFNYSRNIKEVIFEEGSNLKRLGSYFCTTNRKLTEIKFADSIEELGFKAGHTCHDFSKLIRIYLPKNLKVLYGPLSWMCPNLKEIVYQGTVEEFNNILNQQPTFNRNGYNGKTQVDHEVMVKCSDQNVYLNIFGDILDEDHKELYHGIDYIVRYDKTYPVDRTKTKIKDINEIVKWRPST